MRNETARKMLSLAGGLLVTRGGWEALDRWGAGEPPAYLLISRLGLGRLLDAGERGRGGCRRGWAAGRAVIGPVAVRVVQAAHPIAVAVGERLDQVTPESVALVGARRVVRRQHQG